MFRTDSADTGTGNTGDLDTGIAGVSPAVAECRVVGLVEFRFNLSEPCLRPARRPRSQYLRSPLVELSNESGASRYGRLRNCSILS